MQAITATESSDPRVAAPHAVLRKEGQRAVLVLSGDWGRDKPRPPVAPLLAELDESGARGLGFETTHLGPWDSALLAFVKALHGWAGATEDRTLDASNLPEDLRQLLELATAVPPKTDAEREVEAENLFARLGRGILSFKRDLFEGLEFTGLTAMAMAAFATGRARMRRSDFLITVQRVGAEALPIVTLISFLVGLIIAFLGAVVLVRFGADYYISYLIGYGMLREMGAVMAGVILAGRTGAAFAAQIGSMKVSEEIDALRTFGIDPMEFIVLPRVLALIVMMPLLVIYADAVGMASGAAVSMAMLNLSIGQFLQGLQEAVGPTDFALGVIKGSVFGVLIAMAGCFRGMQAGGGADAVGQAATKAVVTGITLIVLANAIIDWIAASHGI